jgi:hypothetical protein
VHYIFAFAGAAGAGLPGLNVIWGLAVFYLAGALGIGGWAGGPGRTWSPRSSWGQL